MPRVFTARDIEKEEKEVKRDYLDRHMPRVICDKTAKRNEKFKVRVVVGDQYDHPDDPDHFINYVQLWNRETFIAETHYGPGAQGFQKSQVEMEFMIIPKVSMNLTAMSYCTKHGLWKSESVEVKVVD